MTAHTAAAGAAAAGTAREEHPRRLPAVPLKRFLAAPATALLVLRTAACSDRTEPPQRRPLHAPSAVSPPPSPEAGAAPDAAPKADDGAVATERLLRSIRRGYVRRGAAASSVAASPPSSAPAPAPSCLFDSYPAVSIGRARRRQVPVKRGGKAVPPSWAPRRASGSVVRFADLASVVEIPPRGAYPASVAAALWNSRRELRRLAARNAAELALERKRQRRSTRPSMLPPPHRREEEGSDDSEDDDSEDDEPGAAGVQSPPGRRCSSGAAVVPQSHRRLDRHRRSAALEAGLAPPLPC